MDQFVQFLFKYKWSLFAKGDLRLANRPSWLILALILIAFGALIYFLYIRPPYRISISNRVGLASILLD